MALKALIQRLGIIFSGKGNTTNRSYQGEEGLIYNKNDEEMRTHIQGSDRALLTDTQTQTVQNKTITSAQNSLTIDADVSTVSNVKTTNLKAGVLDTDLSDGTSASHDTLPSAKATKDYVDAQIATKDEASEISYNNATSGLTATQVQAAIDEVEGRLDTAETGLSDHLADPTDAHDASAISYVNATSGLTATDTQAAIDEVEGRLDTAESNISTNSSNHTNHLNDTTDAHDASAISYVNTTSGLAATDTQAAIDEVDGDLDTHIAASTAHGISGSVVGTTDTQDISNKTFTDALTLEEQASTPSNPASGDKKFYAKNDGKLYTLDSAGNEIEVGSGGAGSGINFIDNSDAEVDTTGYATYADAAATTPVDGTGGSPAGVTFTRSEVSPLIGDASFVLAKDAANRQGEGASYDFTIDSIFQSKVLEISFYKDFSDANIADGDIRCFIYDVTNASLIEPVGVDLTADKRSARLSFQTAPDSTSYRLIFHVASTSTSAFSAKLDNISVGPLESIFSEKVIAFKSTFSSAQNITTSAVLNFDTISYDTNANFDTANNRFIAPESGYYTFDVNVLLDNSPSPQDTNIQLRKNGATFNQKYGAPLAGTTSTIVCDLSDSIYLEKDDYVDVFAVGDASFDVDINTNRTNFSGHKISGLSLSSVSESDIVVVYKDASAQAIGTSATLLDYPTKVTDTHNAFDGTRFTAPESGIYLVSASYLTDDESWSAGNFADLSIDINGSGTFKTFQDRKDAAVTSSIQLNSGAVEIPLNKGQQLEFYGRASIATNTNATGGGIYNVLSISKKKGASVSSESKPILDVTTKSTTYTALTTDQVILVNTASAWTLSLYSAIGNTGRTLKVIKTSSDLNPLTIDPNGSETINGKSTFKLNTQNESINLMSDGTNWVILDHKYDWQTSYTPSILGSTTNPTKGTTNFDICYVHRDGAHAVFEYQYSQSGAGTTGSGFYTYTLPSGLVVDSTQLTGSNATQEIVLSAAHTQDSTNGILTGSVGMASTTSFYIAVSDDVNAPDLTGNTSGYGDLSNAIVNFTAKFRVRIEDWDV